MSRKYAPGHSNRVELIEEKVRNYKGLGECVDRFQSDLKGGRRGFMVLGGSE